MAEVMAREVPRLRRLPDGIEATDTATCFDCPDGVGHPSKDGWTCHDCGGIWGYGDETLSKMRLPHAKDISKGEASERIAAAVGSRGR